MLRCRCWTALSSWTRLTNFRWWPAVAVWSKQYNLSAINCRHSEICYESDCTVTQVRLERAEEGRVDAAAALNMEPGSSRAILALGEALYCLGQAQHRTLYCNSPQHFNTFFFNLSLYSRKANYFFRFGSVRAWPSAVSTVGNRRTNLIYENEIVFAVV